MITRRIFPALFLFLALNPFVLAQSPEPGKDDPLKESFKTLRDKFAPDRRVAVFDLAWDTSPSGLVLKGEVDNPSAKQEALAVFKKASGAAVVDSIRVLPDTAFGENVYGIVTLSVGNMRSKPGNSEELSSQVLMGMVVKLLKKQSGHFYVQSHDKYLGWIDTDALFVTDRAGVDSWAAAKKVIVTGYFGIVREESLATAQPVCDVVIGNMLKTFKTGDTWTEVELADGRKGYLERSLVEDYDTWKSSRAPNGPNVEKAAKMFVGVPYLWGGTSSKGMDCSGFTKTVYRLNGIELNRDANQQATMGEDVPMGDNFENLQKGDLLFFGRKASGGRPERISHVAIYLENEGFIHSSGRVRFGSFDPASQYYDEFDLRRLVRARRVLPSTDIPEVRKQLDGH
ncbi:MAG: C40 family peptidase [Bacteroidota bacterium]